MKLVIINISQYKDNDAILTCFNAENSYTLIARGLFSNKSKISFLNNPLTYADIDISVSKRNNYQSVKSANLIFSPMQIMNDFNDIIYVMILADVIKRCLSDEERCQIFSELLYTLSAIKNNSNKETYILSLLAKILKIAGFAISIDECCICHNKQNIVSFSLSDGGFICKNCFDKGIYTKFNKEQLITFYNVFKNFSSAKNNFTINEKDFFMILDIMIKFIEESFSIKIKNYQLLSK